MADMERTDFIRRTEVECQRLDGVVPWVAKSHLRALDLIRRTGVVNDVTSVMHMVLMVEAAVMRIHWNNPVNVEDQVLFHLDGAELVDYWTLVVGPIPHVSGMREYAYVTRDCKNLNKTLCGRLLEHSDRPNTREDIRQRIKKFWG